MATKIMNAIKTKAAEVGKAKAAAGKAKEAAQAAAAKPVAKPAPKGDSFEKVKAAYANETNRINAAKAAGTYKAPEVRGMLGGGGGPPSRPMGGMGARAGATRPAMTPQVKQGLQGLSDKLRAMPMKKGGATKAKKK